MKKIIWIIFLCVIFLFGIFLVGNNYQMTEEKVSISTTGGNLSAVMTFPKKKKIKGVIIFVHGDGAQLATQDGGYYPLMERFAKQGYVSISWDKLGVGGSSGNWLSQSMNDRANEVSQVISWLKSEHRDVTKSIGLWGASQAGWVVPKVMNDSKNTIDFALLVAPAINWIRQGEYNTIWQAKDNNESLKEAQQNFKSDVEIIKKSDTFDIYKRNGGTDTMTENRYQFVKRNMEVDITEDLKETSQPIALILAENDKNVDSKETIQVYEDNVKAKLLDTKIINKVDHQMINSAIAQSNLLINIVGLMVPKYLLIDKEYLEFCEKYVANQ
ncbi:alpha/beta hydrolase family protein [Enterococcus sp. LJL99]